jgi:predicted MFS family arabinose efflux permease
MSRGTNEDSASAAPAFGGCSPDETSAVNIRTATPSFAWLLLLCAALTTVAAQVVSLSIAPLLPQIAASLSVNMGVATTLLTAFLLTTCLSVVFVGGAFCDRYGVLAALLLSAAFSAVPATVMPWLGTSYHSVLGLRLLEGLASGFVIPTIGPIVATWFPPGRRGSASGLLSASSSVGSAAGLLGGPALFSLTGSWQRMSAWLSLCGWLPLLFAACLMWLPAGRRAPYGEPVGAADNTSAFRHALATPFTWLGVAASFMAAWVMMCLLNLTPGYLAAARPVGAGLGAALSGDLMLGVSVAGIIGPLLCGLLLDKFLRGSATTTLLLGFVLSCVGVFLVRPLAAQGHVGLLESALIAVGLGSQFCFTSIYLLVAIPTPPRLWANSPVCGWAWGLWAVSWACRWVAWRSIAPVPTILLYS